MPLSDEYRDTEVLVTGTAGLHGRGRGFLASLPPAQRALIIASGVLGALLVAGSAAGLAIRVASAPASTGSARRRTISVPPSDAATSSAPTSATPSASSSTSAAGTSQGDAASATPAIKRAALVAFRRGGAVFVASERGADARSIAVSADGVFSLSPDGLALALVDIASGQLSVVTVSTGVAVVSGPAAQSAPVWSPDSTWLVYRRNADTGSELVRVAREGGPVRPLGAGSSPVITNDGAWVFAVRADATGSSRIVRIPAAGGAGAPVPGRGAAAGVSEVAVSGTRVFFASPGAGSGPPTISSMTHSGGDVRTLVATWVSAPNVSFTSLRPSPDGSWLAYQESGDDGYSRILCVRASGGVPSRLSLRYDAYVIGWSADGMELLFAEGNTLQGETSRIAAVRPDGSGRRLIAEGAGL